MDRADEAVSRLGADRLKTDRPDDESEWVGMDELILAEVESWWVALASGIAGPDGALSPRQVQRAARQAVELLVFLGMGEDRGVLPAGTLEALAGHGSSWFPERLEPIHQQIGSALFEVQSEDWGKGPKNHRPPEVRIDGRVLKRIAAGLSKRDLAGHLADRPVELLGRIHEHLLGRRLEQGAGGPFKIRRSTAGKKTGGVFYTPEYVTRYIVTHSVGKQLEARGAEGAGDLDPAVLDPACGCGAFLLAVWRCLEQWCRENGWPSHPACLAKHIHGVDVDPEAVLVARRSLWLEMMHAAVEAGSGSRPGQGCPRQTLLRDVAENVRWGDVLSDAALAGQAGRFDVVLGNPPYRRELNTKRLLDGIAATELGRRWRTARMDLWYYFLHRGMELLKPGGRLSFIVGSYWTSGKGAQKLIGELCRSARIEEIFSLGRRRVFPGVAGRHMIITVVKQAGTGPTRVKTPATEEPGDAEPLVSGAATVRVFEKTAAQLFRAGQVDLEPPCDELLAKIARGVPLDTLGDVRQGIAENPAAVTGRANRRHGNRWTTGEGVFALTPEELAALKLPAEELALIRPYYDLCDLGRYFLAEEASLALIYSTEKTWPRLDQQAVLRDHLSRFRPIMEARRETRQGARRWWQLHWPREDRLWHTAKIVSVQMGRRPAFVPATRPVYVPFSTNVFVPRSTTGEHLNYLAAVLNSRLMWTWYRHHAKRRGVGLEINGHVLRRTPIRRIDFSNAADKSRHDRIVTLVDQMLKRGRESSSEPLVDTDRRIDRLVCELYGLSDQEMATVEE